MFLSGCIIVGKTLKVKKVEKIGINDTFGKSGKWTEVYKYFGLTKESIMYKFLEE